MPALVDTTIRLLSQEPLAERVAAARLYELADVLDEAGFAYLEVSGGGGFDVFRIHDPLNDLGNLREAADAIRAAEKELTVGLVHNPGPAGQTDVMLERAHGLAELGAARVVVHDPAGSLHPGQAGELMAQMADASGLPVGFYRQGSGGAALASALEAVRAGAALVACALYPVALSLHRVSAESLTQALAGLGLDTGVALDTLWRGSELVDEALGDEPVPPLSPRVAVRAAEYRLPAGLVAGVDHQLRGGGVADRAGH